MEVNTITAGGFSFLQNAQTGSGLRPACFLMDTGEPGVKLSGLEVNHSPSCAEVKNEWNCTSAPLYTLMA
jgi:hypothetical protein